MTALDNLKKKQQSFAEFQVLATSWNTQLFKMEDVLIWKISDFYILAMIKWSIQGLWNSYVFTILMERFIWCVLIKGSGYYRLAISHKIS